MKVILLICIFAISLYTYGDGSIYAHIADDGVTTEECRAFYDEHEYLPNGCSNCDFCEEVFSDADLHISEGEDLLCIDCLKERR